MSKEKEENKNKEEDTNEEHDRHDVRRTLKDRRSTWKHSNYKGPQHRYHLRRKKKDRREDDEPEDDLVKHIP